MTSCLSTTMQARYTRAASVTHTCLIMTPRATIKSHTCHLMEQPCRNQRTACCNRDTVIMSCSVIEQKRCQ